MKIYKRVIIDLKGNILEEHSFEYSGEIAECKGGTDFPPPTAEEQALTVAQTDLIQQQVDQITMENTMMLTLWPLLEDYYTGQITYADLQLQAATELLPLETELAGQGVILNQLQIDAIESEIAQNEALRPVLLEAMGYELDESGNYIPIEGEEDPIVAQLGDRFTRALEGEDGVSPYLESQLTKERTKLEEDLSRKLGPNWKTTTPGIQALSEFDTRAGLLREESQQSTIATAGSQYFTGRGVMAGEQQQKVSNLLSLTGRTPTGITPTGAGGAGMPTGGVPGMGGLMGGGGGSASAGISDLQDYYRTGRYQKWAAGEGQRVGRTQAMMGGAIAGATIGAPGGAPGIIGGAAIGLMAGYLLS